MEKVSLYSRIPGESGAHDWNRTNDLLLTKEVLYRLSYVSVLLLGAVQCNGAGDGNRTRTSSLEGYSSTIELLPPVSRFESNCGGGRWIRTTEGMSQQIYSLPPLAAWVSLRTEPPIVCSEGVGCQGGMERAKRRRRPLAMARV